MASRGKAKNYTNSTPKSNNQKITPEQARAGMLRVMSFIWGVGAGIFTIIFSANGIAAFFYGEPVVMAAGYFMAFGVVFFQLYFYQGYTENKTFLVLSVVAIIYSLWTTWVGLLGTTNIYAIGYEPGKAIVKFIFAILIDWTAEPAILFAIFGRSALHVADAFGSFLDLVIPGDQSKLYKKRSFPNPFKKTSRPTVVQQQPHMGYNNPHLAKARELQNKLNGGK